MFYALSWFVVASLIALWSLAAWAMHAIAVWTFSNVGALSATATGVGAVALPAWLAPWVPPEMAQWVSQLLAAMAPAVTSVLQALPSLAGGFTVMTWVIWGIGTAMLVLLGAGLHLLIALWRRRGRGRFGPGTGRSLAAG